MNDVGAVETTKKVGSRDVARRAGVSQTTVSYVLNGRTDVAIPDATRERVLEAARVLGYRPNRAARALVMGSTHTVELWLPRIHSTYYAQVADTFHHLAMEEGFEVIIRVPDSDGAGRTDGGASDGILCFLPLNASRLDFLRASGTPFVGVCTAAPGFDTVDVDMEGGAAAATQHLIAQGRRRIAHVINRNANLSGDPRREGYARTMQAAGLTVEYILTDEDSCADGCAALREYLRHHSCPDALFCRNDEVAMGAFRAVRDAKWDVPGQVALVGFDGVEATGYFDPPLTTVALPVAELCAKAWEFLRHRMNEPNGERRQEILPTRLLIRGSSGRASSS